MRRSIFGTIIFVAAFVALLSGARSALATQEVVSRQLSGAVPSAGLMGLGTHFVSGDRVVWTAGDTPYGTEQQLLTMTFAETSPSVLMTCTPAENMAASIGGGFVAAVRTAAWSLRGDVYLFDLATGDTRKLTTTRSRWGVPVVSDRWAVWPDYGTGNPYEGTPSTFVAYDLHAGTTSLIPVEPGPSPAPSVSGDLLAWEQGPTVIVYDLAGGRESWRSPADVQARTAPAISGTWVAFGFDRTPMTFNEPFNPGMGYNGSTDVFAHDLLTGQDIRIPKSVSGYTGYPMLDGDSVYWQQSMGASAHILASTLTSTGATTPSVVATVAAYYYDSPIDVSGGHVVWSLWQYGEQQLWGTETGTPTSLTLRADRTVVGPGRVPVRLSGTAAGVSDGAVVRIERSGPPDYGYWQLEATATVTAGRISTTVTVPSASAYRLRFLGDPGHGASASAAIRVLPLARLSTPSVSAAPRRGRAVTITGTMMPPAAFYSGHPLGAYLYIERRSGAGWVSVARVRAGLYKVVGKTSYQLYKGSFVPKAAGAYRVRAVAPATALHARTTTAWRGFTVR